MCAFRDISDTDKEHSSSQLLYRDIVSKHAEHAKTVVTMRSLKLRCALFETFLILTGSTPVANCCIGI